MSADDARRGARQDGAEPPGPVPQPAEGGRGPRARRSVAEALRRAQGYLLARQHPDGYWLGELEADVSVTAGYVPVMHAVTGRVDPVRRDKAVAFVRSRQRADGSWPVYHGGPGNLDVSIQAYFGLKLAGVPGNEPAMGAARSFIVSQGGAERANLVTKVWLAVFGQYDYDRIPTVPPELMLLPENGPFSIYDFASWSRETLVALTLVSALRPRFEIPDTARVPELFAASGADTPPEYAKAGWPAFFRAADVALKLWDRLPVRPGRRSAIARAESWLVRHQEADGSWGGILLPWVYALFALKALGYATDHPVIARALEGLEAFVAEDDESLRLQPAMSPVWDTAWAVLALRESGLPADHPALQRAGAWLLGQEIRNRGDWHVKNPGLTPAGWAFEFENDWYPDLDDTPVVARALHSIRVAPEREPEKEAAIRRALGWTLGMQSRDGGFAAFDRDNDMRVLAHVPFSDFVPPLDPTCADVTAHVIELFGALGERGAPYRRALAFLARTQESDGAWYGRWGVNYLYGTGLALAALGPEGRERLPDAVRRAAEWLAERQNEDGGWGETCASYEQPGPATRGRGPSTASQTAWAVLGLTAARGAEDPGVRRGIERLLETQREAGDWLEEDYTGTGFPGTFYLRYDLYRVSFPLLALARAATSSSG